MDSYQALMASAAAQHGVLTVNQLTKAGFSKSKLRYWVSSGQLRRAGPGVLTLTGSPETWLQRASAASLAAQPGGAGSHRLASRMFGMRSVDSELDVTVPYPRRLDFPGARTIRSRDIRVSDLTWVEGVPVTTPERTICDLGLIFPEEEVMRILRHAVSTGLVNRRDVRRMRIRIGRQGRNGAGIVGRCLDRLPGQAEQTESGIEALFAEICEQWQLPRPVLQLPVIAGGRSYRVDFAYPRERVFIEIDGRSHHEGHEAVAADGGRQNNLVAAGWHPLRFTYRQLRDDPAGCAGAVVSALATHQQSPTAA